MSKKDISKILTTGSTKQKLLLIAEDRARNRFESSHPQLKGREQILTEKETNAIYDSFKTSQEIKLWNNWLKYDRTVINAITNLQAVSSDINVHYANLRGYILVWNSIENSELLVNSVLHEIKDPEERKRIAEGGGKGVDLLFSETLVDQEGYIDIKIDFERDSFKDEKGNYIRDMREKRKTKEFSLLYVMSQVKDQATQAIIKYLSWKEAILDYMKETGFNVQTYKDLLQVMTGIVCEPVIGWDKYTSEAESFIQHIPNKRLDKLKAKYNITPKISELEIDKDIYNSFMTNFLRDE